MVLDKSIESVSANLKALAESDPMDPVQLATTVENKVAEKYDHCLPDDLLCRDYASRSLDVQGAWDVLSDLSKNLSP